MESMLRDMRTKDLNAFAKEAFGIDLNENDPEILPDSQKS